MANSRIFERFASNGARRVSIDPARLFSRRNGSAGFQPAVSRVCNPQTAELELRASSNNTHADCKSAIQQVGNLRYSAHWTPTAKAWNTDLKR